MGRALGQQNHKLRQPPRPTITVTVTSARPTRRFRKVPPPRSTRPTALPHANPTAALPTTRVLASALDATSESERNVAGRRPIPIGAAEVGSASPLSVLLRLRRSRFSFPIGRATIGPPRTAATAGPPDRAPASWLFGGDGSPISMRTRSCRSASTAYDQGEPGPPSNRPD